MSVDSVYKLFFDAMLALTGSSTIETRLAYALRSLHHLTVDGIPSEIASDVIDIEKIFYRDFEGTYEEYIDTMSDYEAQKIAEKILEVFTKVVELDAVEQYQKDEDLNN